MLPRVRLQHSKHKAKLSGFDQTDQNSGSQLHALLAHNHALAKHSDHAVGNQPASDAQHNVSYSQHISPVMHFIQMYTLLLFRHGKVALVSAEQKLYCTNCLPKVESAQDSLQFPPTMYNVRPTMLAACS